MNLKKKKIEKITILLTVSVFIGVVFFTVKSLFGEQFQYTNTTAYVPAFFTTVNYREYTTRKIEPVYGGDCSESLDLSGNNILKIDANRVENYNMTVNLNKNSSTASGYIKNIDNSKFYAISNVKKLIMHRQTGMIEGSFEFSYLDNGRYTEKRKTLKNIFVQCSRGIPPEIQPTAVPHEVRRAGIIPGTILIDPLTSLNLTTYKNTDDENSIINSIIEQNAKGTCRFYYTGNGSYVIEYSAQSIFNNLNYDVKYTYNRSSTPVITAMLNYNAANLGDASDINTRKFYSYSLSDYTDSNVNTIYLTPSSIYIDMHFSYQYNSGLVSIYTTMLCVN